jgi:hypothetical protein
LAEAALATPDGGDTGFAGVAVLNSRRAVRSASDLKPFDG